MIYPAGEDEAAKKNDERPTVAILEVLGSCGSGSRK